MTATIVQPKLISWSSCQTMEMAARTFNFNKIIKKIVAYVTCSLLMNLLLTCHSIVFVYVLVRVAVVCGISVRAQSQLRGKM